MPSRVQCWCLGCALRCCSQAWLGCMPSIRPRACSVACTAARLYAGYNAHSAIPLALTWSQQLIIQHSGVPVLTLLCSRSLISSSAWSAAAFEFVVCYGSCQIRLTRRRHCHHVARLILTSVQAMLPQNLALTIHLPSLSTSLECPRCTKYQAFPANCYTAQSWICLGKQGGAQHYRFYSDIAPLQTQLPRSQPVNCLSKKRPRGAGSHVEADA
jgi:hypothetical protein